LNEDSFDCSVILTKILIATGRDMEATE
jgi:hypothetical protein